MQNEMAEPTNRQAGLVAIPVASGRGVIMLLVWKPLAVLVEVLLDLVVVAEADAGPPITSPADVQKPSRFSIAE